LLPEFLQINPDIEPYVTGTVLILIVIFLPGGQAMTTESDPRASPAIQLREYRPEDDAAAYVEIHNLIFSPERTTVEQELYWDSIYPQDNPRCA
jgi:hypothetical protein